MPGRPNIRRLPGDPDELVDVAFDLYPTEVVRAAQKELGANKLKENFIEIYEYVRRCKDLQGSSEKTQFSGVLLAHAAIEQWLESKDVNDVYDLQEPAILKMYLESLIARMEASLSMFKQIVKAIS